VVEPEDWLWRQETLAKENQLHCRRRDEKRNIWLYGAKMKEEKVASEMPRAPIKVEIVGFVK
jgi:hypothetical protein